MRLHWLFYAAAMLTTTTVSVGVVSCTKQQGQSLVDLGVQVAIDTCEEAPSLVPPGAQGVTALLCQALNANQDKVKVLIDTALFGTMKAQYIREHGALPKGYAKP